MRVYIFILTTMLAGTDCMAQSGFRDSQLRFPRVRQAYGEKWDMMEGWLRSSQIDRETMEIYLAAYKQEKIVEVWARNRGEQQFRKLITYQSR